MASATLRDLIECWFHRAAPCATDVEANLESEYLYYFNLETPCAEVKLSIYPTIYNRQSIPEAVTTTARLHDIAAGTIGARTSTLTWHEVTWIMRRRFDPRKATVQGASFLILPDLKLLKVDVETISESSIDS
jgi:hypothetical protein